MTDDIAKGQKPVRQTLLPSPSLPNFDPATLPGKRVELGKDAPLRLDCGGTLGPYWIAYQTYGTLNADKSNVILVCHALTGDQYMAEPHPVTGKPGWWEQVVGPSKLIDTNRYFVICANILGGCMGSEGPRNVNGVTGKIWGLDFPVITVHDMVRAQKALIDHLGIPKIFMVLGGSLGGMQALSWASLYPDHIYSCVAIAAAAKHSAQNIAFGEVGRQAIMADPFWHQGKYLAENTRPAAGLSVARMAAHITYLSEAALQRKFGRRLQDRSAVSFGFNADFQVESYLRYQGESFIERFDPNSYLYITRAMDYFDLANDLGGGNLAHAFTGTKTRFLVVSFTSDWLFPTSESRTLVQALTGANADISFVDIETDKGHDAFLLDEPEFHRQLAGFIQGCEDSRRLTSTPLVSSSTEPLRDDLRMISDLVPAKSRVLDVGCGNGALLKWLTSYKQVRGFGLEMDRTRVQNAVAKGLAVIQGDANTDLATYPDNAFDVAILNRTLTEIRRPLELLQELKRIAPTVIVSVANFGHWQARLSYALQGRSPISPSLPYEWYDSPNIRFCTIRDFQDFAAKAGMKLVKSIPLDNDGRPIPAWQQPFANFFASQSLNLLSR
jgi:homoserine O-acetyltransferase